MTKEHPFRSYIVKNRDDRDDLTHHNYQYTLDIAHYRGDVLQDRIKYGVMLVYDWYKVLAEYIALMRINCPNNPDAYA